MRTPAPGVGDPPPLRGFTIAHRERFTIACHASAIVLDLQGYPDHAAQLRLLATRCQVPARASSPLPAAA